MDGTECDSTKMLGEYNPPVKNPNKQAVFNYRLDMNNVIVLRLFGTDKYIYIKYDRANITNLDQLREKIPWSKVDSIDDSIKNKNLKEEKGLFRNHLQLSYLH